MKFTTVAALSTLTFAGSALARQFTVRNNCAFTIWPAIFTDLNVGTEKPDKPTGWKAAAGSVSTFPVPDNWRAGRIWGRRNCDFTKTGLPDYEMCTSGGCNGGLLCNENNGAGVPPATLAEFTFDGTDDWYDVSLVDGYNLPIAITNNQDCPLADCPIDLASKCPDQLKGPFDPSGAPLGCKTACFANLDGNQANSKNCCSGDFSTPDKCPASGVQFYDYFKKGCPNAYAYAYDEASETALFKCPAAKKADYTITFCP